MNSRSIPIYQVDAFADRVFAGNPAAVCPLEKWLPKGQMQAITAENNLSNTAFFVPVDDVFAIRWFTPQAEVDLCGHATMASAHVLWEHLGYPGDMITFQTLKSGTVRAKKKSTRIVLNFPARPPHPCTPPENIDKTMGTAPGEVMAARDLVVIYDDEDAVLNLRPDFEAIKAIGCFGVIATAPGREVDFVSRFFTPLNGINEDPVTGSAHCTLIPYWAERLDQTRMRARQLSERGGELFCELLGDRVRIGGHAVTYLEGSIRL